MEPTRRIIHTRGSRPHICNLTRFTIYEDPVEAELDAVFGVH
jgi:hypothetical protein